MRENARRASLFGMHGTAENQPVSDPALGDEELGLVRIILDFAPQPTDENPKILNAIRASRPPNQLDQLPLRDHPPIGASQNMQHFEFLRSESQRLPAQGHSSRRRVYGEMAGLIDERNLLEAYARSERRPRPRQKFSNLDRFANEVVGAEISPVTTLPWKGDEAGETDWLGGACAASPQASSPARLSARAQATLRFELLLDAMEDIKVVRLSAKNCGPESSPHNGCD